MSPSERRTTLGQQTSLLLEAAGVEEVGTCVVLGRLAAGPQRPGFAVDLPGG